MLLVDAANVVGARADGWWRDRPGAAGRLVADLRAALAEGRLQPPVVVVLEGHARRGADEASEEGLRIVHAPGSGDDALAELAAGADEPVVLVSADRALRARAATAGATAVGPRWLLARLA